MTLAVQISFVLSVTLFLGYGFSCLFMGAMVDEFARYNLSRFRRLVGLLEVLGALGLLASLLFPPLVFPSGGGLALLMALGVITRVRVRDPLIEALPAGVLMVINLFLCVAALQGVQVSR
ncbi:DoxX family protein [Gemmatimonas groenlandica]|uniref:DoxX family protein n=1 Tax=Gemmatimonas groenlandica TaxID=2732249 RepID=A0A6M4IRU6_9BACT|nr:DoxX family protein [Gemmatimonas groenlandica]QJR36748.1 hypothetical protein HKW67_15105 [Gemmatimonas groenlandica]